MLPRIKQSMGLKDNITLIMTIDIPESMDKESRVKYLTDEVYRRVSALYLSGPSCLYSGSINVWNNDLRNSLGIEEIKEDKDNNSVLVMLTIPRRFQEILDYWSQLKLFKLKEEDVSTPSEIHKLNKRISRNNGDYHRKWNEFYQKYPELRS
jgi:hypothetical protein